MQGPDYKKKYLELRTKYINDLDAAFRLGVEAGAQQAQQQQTLDSETKMHEEKMQTQQIQAGGLAGGASPEEGTPSEGAPQQPGMDAQAHQQGSELDQHIGKLEGMLGSDKNPEIQKSLNAIVSLRKSQKEAEEMKKSQSAIQGIAKALHKPAFKIGQQASHNLSDNSKKAVNMQEKIVNDIMKTWSNQETKAKNSIANILNVEGLLPKE